MFRLLIIVILIIVVLSLLGVNITSLINNQTLQQNLQAAWDIALSIWNNYLKEPFQKGLTYLIDQLTSSDVKIEGQNMEDATTTLETGN